jgi:hypothetical protein
MGMGRERGGGRSVYKQPWTREDRVAPQAKEGFQVSKRDSETGEGSSGRGGIIKGFHQGDCAMCSHIMLNLYISCYCVYVVLIKELCLGYK